MVPHTHNVPGPYCIQSEYPRRDKTMTKTLQQNLVDRDFGILADLDSASKVGKSTYPLPYMHPTKVGVQPHPSYPPPPPPQTPTRPHPSHR